MNKITRTKDGLLYVEDGMMTAREIVELIEEQIEELEEQLTKLKDTEDDPLAMGLEPHEAARLRIETKASIRALKYLLHGNILRSTVTGEPITLADLAR